MAAYYSLSMDDGLLPFVMHPSARQSELDNEQLHHESVLPTSI